MRTALEVLDDRILKDIGLSRCDIDPLSDAGGVRIDAASTRWDPTVRFGIRAQFHAPYSTTS